MATIDNQHIPDFIIDELQRIVDSIQADSLLSFVKARSELIKGFRPTKSNLQVIRKRLKTLVGGPGEIDQGIIYFLAGESFQMEFVGVFSATALLYLFDQFVRFFGVKFIAAVLLDTREMVRKLAFDYLDRGSEDIQGTQGEPDASLIRAELAPFLVHIASLYDDKQSCAVEPSGGENDDIAQELERCRKEIVALEKRLTQKEDGDRKEKKLEKKLGDKIGTKDREIAELREKLEREKQRGKERDGICRQQAAEFAELQETFGERLQKSVDKEMRASVRGWLKKPSRRELVVSNMQKEGKGDLLVRVDDLLARQEVLDRDFGNKRLLAGRLEQLEEARARIVESGSVALNPLPGLLSVKKELDREIKNIRNVLSKENKDNVFLDNLKIKINSAPDSKTLSSIKALLMGLEQSDILGAADLKDMYTIYNQRMSIFYEKYGFVVDEKEGGDTAWRLKKALDEKREIHLILDGHNILFGLTDLFVEFYDEGIPSVKAREKLLGLIDAVLQGSSAQASVFFDGAVASEQTFSLNVKEIYSGGGASDVRNRADQAIVDFLTAVKRGDEKVTYLVVTNDLELQRLVLEKGAKIIPLMQFAALLSELHA